MISASTLKNRKSILPQSKQKKGNKLRNQWNKQEMGKEQRQSELKVGSLKRSGMKHLKEDIDW